MLLTDFDYALPPELIAQHPPARRDAGRLLLLRRQSGEISHHRVTDLASLLPSRSLVVLNDTRVHPARLRARRASGGKVEILLISRLGSRRWRALLRSSKALRCGEVLFAEDEVRPVATVATEVTEGRAEVDLSDATLPQRLGEIPLPPYIRRVADEQDRERYQTVYAREEGSVAAPTAGLHLTRSLIERLEQHGATIAHLTLHVGPGTFVPVRCEDPAQHVLEQERYEVSQSAGADVEAAKRDGRSVVAVGTTVVRTLETTGGRAGSGETGLFVLPGYRFRVVDALLTNFHLPRSTLLMLVCAFGGRERVLAAYAEAVRLGYRFYSYGDAMLIL